MSLRDHPPRPSSDPVAQIRMLRISITDRCNFRCLYCMPPEGVEPIPHESILRYEEMVAVARAAAEMGILAFKITGGEPLVRKGVESLVTMLRDLDRIENLSLTTNGSLLADHAGRLRQAGLDRVTVSLDTLQPDRFRRITRHGRIDQVWEGIDAARQVGLKPIKINVVAMRGQNDDEFADFAALTIERDLTVRFIEAMPIGRTSLVSSDCFMGESQIREKIAPLGALTPTDGDGGLGPARLYRLPDARGKIGFISAMSSPFCYGCNRIRLTADGHLRPCLFQDRQISITHLLRPTVDPQALRQVLIECVKAKPVTRGCTGQGEMSRVGG